VTLVKDIQIDDEITSDYRQFCHTCKNGLPFKDTEMTTVEQAKSDALKLGICYDRKEAASHVLAMMGKYSPIVRVLAEEILAEPTWSEQPPMRSGTYWHWNGDSDSSPVPIFVMYSGTSGKCFVSRGQLGLSDAINCDEFGGWWQEFPDPEKPSVGI
jgi:hypothetical protein